MKKIYPKGSEEFQMFTDFWKLRQEYAIPESTKEWWTEATNAIHSFAKKYNTRLAILLATAFGQYLEEFQEEIKKELHKGE